MSVLPSLCPVGPGITSKGEELLPECQGPALSGTSSWGASCSLISCGMAPEPKAVAPVSSVSR